MKFIDDIINMGVSFFNDAYKNDWLIYIIGGLGAIFILLMISR